MNTQNSLKTIDLNKHVESIKYSRATNQEEQIEIILVREFYHNKEYEINQIPRINIKELSILGYKNPKKAIEGLVNRGVVKQSGDIIELVTDKVYCGDCNNREVFIWDKENHLKTSHYWDSQVSKHNIGDLKFSNKPFPEEIDHDFERIGELKDNKLEVKCKNCGYERTIYIDHYRHECNPFTKSIFIENPDDQENIKVTIYADHNERVFKNQEELKKFIDSRVNGA